MVQNWGPCCILPPVCERDIITSDLKNKQSVWQRNSLFYFGRNYLLWSLEVCKEMRERFGTHRSILFFIFLKEILMKSRFSVCWPMRCSLEFVAGRSCFLSKTDYIFGFRYQLRILIYAYVHTTVCKIILQTRRGEYLSLSPGGLWKTVLK